MHNNRYSITIIITMTTTTNNHIHYRQPIKYLLFLFLLASNCMLVSVSCSESSIAVESEVAFEGQKNQQQESDIVVVQDIAEFPDYQHQVYSGYLKITDFDKQFYYMMFKTQSDDDNDPLILWLNGGPGCSSMIGMTSENGPFLFKPQSNQMYLNEHAWNKNAHLVYLESPAGVGFSKGKRQSISSVNDTTVAQDNYIALVRFFQKYPDLKDNDFWIAGESYAGIYIPRLAQQIIANNQQETAQDRKINLKGILIGNGCTHPWECYSNKYISRYQVQFMYTHGYVDIADYSQYVATCVTSQNQQSDACNRIQQKIQTNFYNSKANVYNVYQVCYPVPVNSTFMDQYLQKMKQIQQSHNLKYSLRCSDMVGPNSLFNRNQNRAPLHLQSNQTLKWTPCNDVIAANYKQQSRAAYTTLPSLIKYGLQIHYYSGDFDAMVPIQGTIDWLKRYRSDFGASIKRSWRPWLVDGDSLGGMIWQLDGITFWSVIGAGHMVPTDKPKQAKFILDVALGRKKLSTVYEKQIKQM